MFGSEVVAASSEDVTVTLKNGNVLKADVIVGADGYDSVLREIVTGEPELPLNEVEDKKVWITYTLPVNDLLNDPELKSLVDPSLVSHTISS
jgi:salicylate hydroxylase